MITSTICFALAGLVFRLRKMSPFFGKTSRAAQKRKLLDKLDELRKKSLPDLARAASRFADGLLNEASGGAPLGSVSYFLRLGAIGLLFGIAICAIELLFFSHNAVHFLRLAESAGWRRNLLVPTIVTAIVMFPIDAFIAHVLIRWSMRGNAWRAVGCTVLSVAVAYSLLAVGAGLAANLPLLFDGVVIPSLVWNRIEVAFLNPWTSSARISQGSLWISFGGASASAASMGLLASILFSGATALRAFPERIRLLVAWPMFLLLDYLTWLDRKGLNIPLKAIAYVISGGLCFAGIALLLLGL